MAFINNKWFQLIAVLILSRVFLFMGETVAAIVALIGILVVFVPKLREMAKLDMILGAKEVSSKGTRNISGTHTHHEGTDFSTSFETLKTSSGIDISTTDDAIAKLENQDTWLRYSMERWEESDFSYPEWFEQAQYNCQKEGWEFFESIAEKVESDANFSKKIEKEFDLSAYEKFTPTQSDWIEMAVNSYLNRAQAMSDFEKKYKN
jgi:hypothetical protein